MRHPLIIVGLDGATFDVLDPLFSRSRLPALSALANEGLRTELWSTVPPVTLPAWTSFLTGMVPSKHGVTDIFTHSAVDSRPAQGVTLPTPTPPNPLAPEWADGGIRYSYEALPATGHLRTVPTFLDELSRRGMRVVSLGVPGTFPPENVNGICVSGFDAPAVAAASPEGVWPPEFFGTLKSLGGWRFSTFNEFRHGPGRLQRATQALLADIARKERVILHVLQQERWDLFFVHLQASDTAGHHLWHTHDACSPRATVQSDALESVYRRLDTLIGRLRAAAPRDSRFLVVSDHGMGGASDLVVHLNRWLHTQAYLSFEASPPRAAQASLRWLLGRLPPATLSALVRRLPARTLTALGSRVRGSAVRFEHSVAFSDEIDCSPSVWINRRDRFPHGTVDPADVDGLVAELCSKLVALCDPAGRAIFARVLRRSDLPEGPHRDRLPDIVLEPAWLDGYRPSFLASRGPGAWLQRMSETDHTAPKGFGLPGAHRREGVFIAAGPGLPATDLPILKIEQAGAYVYALLGEVAPADVEALPEFLPLLNASQKSSSVPAAKPLQSPYTPAEAYIVAEHLRALGYLDG